MAVATNSPSWEDITKSESYNNLSPAEKADFTRFYARKYIKPQGRDKAVEFLRNNTAKASGVEAGPLARMANAILPYGEEVRRRLPEEFLQGQDATLTAAIARGEPIDAESVKSGVKNLFGDIGDAYSDLYANLKNRNFTGMGAGLKGAALYTAGTMLDPAGIALGGVVGKAVGTGAGAIAKAVPAIEKPLNAVRVPLAGAAAGGSITGSIPIAEGRSPTLDDILPGAIVGAAGAQGASMLSRRAPVSRPGPSKAAPPPGSSSAGSGAGGTTPPPPGSGPSGSGTGSSGSAGAGSRWKSRADFWGNESKSPPPPPKPNWFAGTDEEWAADPEGHINRQAEAQRQEAQRQQQEAERQRQQAEAARQQQQAEAQRQQAEARRQQQQQQQQQQQRQQQQQQQQQQSQQGQQGQQQSQAGSQAPPKNDPNFNFEKRKAEVQGFIDQHPAMQKLIQKATDKADRKINEIKTEIASIAPSRVNEIVGAANIDKINQRKAVVDRIVLEEKRNRNPRADEIRTHVDNIRRQLDVKQSNSIRAQQANEELKNWKSIMDRLMRGEQASSTPEGALGMAIGLPVIQAGGMAFRAVGKQASKLFREIKKAAKQHHERNAAAGLHDLESEVGTGLNIQSQTGQPEANLERSPAEFIQGQPEFSQADQGRMGDVESAPNPQEISGSQGTQGKKPLKEIFKDKLWEFYKDETGSADIPRMIKDVAKLGLKGATHAASVARMVQQIGYLPADLIDSAYKNVGLDVILENFRQAVKHGKTGLPLVDSIRKFFVSNFGVPIEVLDMANEAKIQARAEIMPLRKKSRELQKELSAADQVNLSRQLGERNPSVRTPEENYMVDEIDRLSQLLNEVKTLSDASYMKNKGYYLPRIYRDKFPLISTYIRTAGTIRGHKARGHLETMTPERFAYLSQPWKVVARYTRHGRNMVRLQSAKGDIVNVLEKNSGDYLGDWEMRGAPTGPGGNVTAWRDWTKDERVRMNEIEHGVLRIVQFCNRFEQDYSKGLFFDELSKNPKFALPASGMAPGSEPAGWVLLPNTKNKDGTPKWGKLADHWVEPETYDYLIWTNEWIKNIAWLKHVSLQSAWKRFVTIWSPSYYLNNFMQNSPILEMLGGSMFDMPLALEHAINETQLFQDLEKYSAIKNGAVTRDLAIMLQGDPNLFANPKNLIQVLGEAFKSIEKTGGDVAQATDDLFRIALAIQKQREGVTNPRDLADSVRDEFYDPNNITSAAAEAGSVIAPFIKQIFFAVDRLSSAFVKKPARAAWVMGQLYLAALGVLVAAGYDTDEKRQGYEELQSVFLKKNPISRLPGALPVPRVKVLGQPVQIDTHNWDPLNPVVDSPRVELPYVPAAALPAGPVPLALNALMNIGSKPGTQMRKYSPEGVEIYDDTGKFLRDSFLPSIVGAKGGKIMDAAMGRQDAKGRQYNVPLALLNLLGAKVQPFNQDQSYYDLSNKYQSLNSDISRQVNDLYLERYRNPQDTESIQRKIDDLERRRALITQEWTNALDRASKGILNDKKTSQE